MFDHFNDMMPKNARINRQFRFYYYLKSKKFTSFSWMSKINFNTVIKSFLNSGYL